MFQISAEPLDAARVMAAVRDPAAGAVVVFTGTTRRTNAGRRVVKLEYEAHERMALTEMRRLAAAAKRRWRLRKVAMVHRIGVVPVGEPSVVIAVSAGHRDEAFLAGRWLIDRLKEIVPIWKKEHYRGGAVWIGAQQGGPPRRRAIYPARRGR
ncbi:MAG TPA: molybdenum cofactor biosynthesis protein MoaE [Candidatus Limnocylindria bacterium]|nr:molybdenum cofactor biosynthesis protein MoaE [Candidatus Limnocylindria bacterium]